MEQSQGTIQSTNDLVSIAVLRNEELGGISKSSFYRLLRNPDFPQSYSLSQRIILYSRSEIRKWLESRRGAVAKA